jgi:RecB family endonuclease NucS
LGFLRAAILWFEVHTYEKLFKEWNDNFLTHVAHNVQEACRLVETGFEHVTGEYNGGGKIFRKRK